MDTYTVLDFETSGLNPKDNQIIEVGLIRVESKKVVKKTSFFVLPYHGFKLSKRITEITGIRQADVDKGESIHFAVEQILRTVKQDLLVCHNAPFDVSFLMTAVRATKKTLSVQVCDTLSHARRAYPQLENHKLATLASHLKLNSPTHRALSDCITTLQLFENLKKHSQPKAKTYSSIEPVTPKARHVPQTVSISLGQATETPARPTPILRKIKRWFYGLLALIAVVMGVMMYFGAL